MQEAIERQVPIHSYTSAVKLQMWGCKLIATLESYPISHEKYQVLSIRNRGHGIEVEVMLHGCRYWCYAAKIWAVSLYKDRLF